MNFKSKKQPLVNLVSSSSEEESDELYSAFRDTFIQLMKKKLPESAQMLDIRTLKAIYSEEMYQIESKQERVFLIL
jgi:hypothetical protein